ncbi:myo-inositol oxygenase [Trifolium repens]|nr:myo-inositol oxygenase [Trifolium repens]
MTSICFYSLKDVGHDIFGGAKEKKYPKELVSSVLAFASGCEFVSYFPEGRNESLDGYRDSLSSGWFFFNLTEDLGKVLLLPSFGGLPQWAVVGDTYPVGCRFDESIVHHKYFKENPDYNNPAYNNTRCGIYSEKCGLNNCMMSWGHDDYMYLVAMENKTTLPSAAMFIIRYHSFYGKFNLEAKNPLV